MHLMLRVCVLVNAADYDFEDVLVAHVDKFAYRFVYVARDIAELLVVVVECYSFWIILVVFFPYKLQFCSDFQLLKCDATIPVRKSCDVAVKEMLPLFCSLFHNCKCLIVNYGCKDKMRLCQIMVQSLKFLISDYLYNSAASRWRFLGLTATCVLNFS